MIKYYKTGENSWQCGEWWGNGL